MLNCGMFSIENIKGENQMTLYFIRFLKVALVALVLSSCATSQKTISPKDELQEKMGLLAQEIASPITKRIRVAVVEFTDIRGKRSNLGMLLAVKLTGDLYNTGKFDIMERERTQLHKIMEELRLSLSDLVDESSARRLGRQLAAEAILTGIIVDLGGSVDVNARLINVETGAILAMADVEITKDARVSKLLRRGRLRLSMNILAEREIDGGYQEVLVREGGTLRSGDTFQVHFSTNEDCYAYVFIYDSQGKIQRLFPDSRMDLGDRIRGAELYSVPPGNLWFELDEHIGTETIYVLASYEPLPEMNRLFLEMADLELERTASRLEGEEETHVFSFRDVKERGKEEKKPKTEKEREKPKHAKKPKKPIRIAGVLRGIKGVTEGKSVTYHLSDGREITKHLQVMEGEEFVARTISFRHE